MSIRRQHDIREPHPPRIERDRILGVVAVTGNSQAASNAFEIVESWSGSSEILFRTCMLPASYSSKLPMINRMMPTPQLFQGDADGGQSSADLFSAPGAVLGGQECASPMSPRLGQVRSETLSQSRPLTLRGEPCSLEG